MPQIQLFKLWMTEVNLSGLLVNAWMIKLGRRGNKGDVSGESCLHNAALLSCEALVDTLQPCSKVVRWYKLLEESNIA